MSGWNASSESDLQQRAAMRLVPGFHFWFRAEGEVRRRLQGDQPVRCGLTDQQMARQRWTGLLGTVSVPSARPGLAASLNSRFSFLPLRDVS